MHFFCRLLVLGGRRVYSSAFIVHQNEQALVLRFGKPKQVITEPGLNGKCRSSRRSNSSTSASSTSTPREQEVTAADQQRLIVDAFARYRIIDPLKFYQNVRNVERVQLGRRRR